MRERGQALADQVARYVSEHMAAPITLENLVHKRVIQQVLSFLAGET